MSSQSNIKRILTLLVFGMVMTSICAVSVQAESKKGDVCYPAGDGYVYCDYGMDMTKKNLTGAAEAKSDNKWAGYRQIYLGGTWDTALGGYAEGAAYNYDGVLIDKFTFEITKNSNDKSPLNCEADLYINDGKTKYCTFQIIELCNELSFLMEDWESPALDEDILQLFEQFASDFIGNSKLALTSLLEESESEPEDNNCLGQFVDDSDSELLESLITELLDAYEAGLLDDLSQEKFEAVISVLLEEYEFSLAEDAQVEATVSTQSGDNGADIIRIRKNEAVCRLIGTDYSTGLDMILCFYGHRVDTSTIKHDEDVTNVRILAFEELYLGGSWTDGSYNYDGQFFGKFRKDFKYNDNANIFWKVEVGLCGSTLSYCTMRDMEYSDTSRVKESCIFLFLSYYSPPDPDCFGGGYRYKKKYWPDYEKNK
jgi:hypothetical protein